MKLDKVRVRVEYQFEDPEMRELVGWGFKALEKYPVWVRTILDEKDQKNDLAQEVYCAAISFAQMTRRQRDSFAPEIKDPVKRRYKSFVRFVGQELYAAIRELIPEYKRKYFTKFMDPGKLKSVEHPGRQGVLPYAKEQCLLPADQEA